MGKGKNVKGKGASSKGVASKTAGTTRKIAPLRISAPKPPKPSKSSSNKKASRKSRASDSVAKGSKRSPAEGEEYETGTDASDPAFVRDRVKMTCTCPHLLSHSERPSLLKSLKLLRSQVNGEHIVRYRATVGAFGALDGDGMGSRDSQCKDCEHHSLEEADDVLTCLHCGYTGCTRQKHLLRHCLCSLGQAHCFAASRSRAEVFCALCCDYVYDAEFDAAVACMDDSYALAEGGGGDSSSRKRRCQARDDGYYLVSDQWGQQPGRDSSLWPPKPPLSPKRRRLVAAGIRGMFNLGNTCFMSSVMQQAMLHTSVVQSFFLRNGHEQSRCEQLRNEIPKLVSQIQQLASSSGGGGVGASSDGGEDAPVNNKLKDYCLPCELSKLFKDILSKEEVEATLEDTEPYVPNRLLEAVWGSSEQLAGYEQQDAHEFLIAVLDNLHGHLIQSAVNEHRIRPLRRRLAQLESQAKHSQKSGGEGTPTAAAEGGGGGNEGDEGGGGGEGVRVGAGGGVASGISGKGASGVGKPPKKVKKAAAEEKKAQFGKSNGVAGARGTAAGPGTPREDTELEAMMAYGGRDTHLSPKKLHGEKLAVDPSSKRPILSPVSPLAGMGGSDPVALMRRLCAGGGEEASQEQGGQGPCPPYDGYNLGDAGEGEGEGRGMRGAGPMGEDTLNGQRLEDLTLAGFVPEVFAGATRSDVVCTGCGGVSCTYERFLEVSLPIHPVEHEVGMGGSRKGRGKDRGGSAAAGHGNGGGEEEQPHETDRKTSPKRLAANRVTKGDGEAERGGGGRGYEGGLDLATAPSRKVLVSHERGTLAGSRSVVQATADINRGVEAHHLRPGLHLGGKEGSGDTCPTEPPSESSSSEAGSGISSASGSMPEGEISPSNGLGGSVDMPSESEVGSASQSLSETIVSSVSVEDSGDFPAVGRDGDRASRDESWRGGGDTEEDEEVCCITNCFARFTAKEELGAPMSCETCKAPMPKTKQMSFCSLPQVLVLHLKRFDSLADKKIRDFVRFPARGLDMGRYLTGWSNSSDPSSPADCQDGVQEVPPPHLPYDLFAVVNHTGSMTQGHYTAFARELGRWFQFDDTWVTEVEEEDVLRSEAYLLFYKRTGADSPWRPVTPTRS
ncbi:unnamed protein product [Discosporangium mesarthrocarpum]